MKKFIKYFIKDDSGSVLLLVVLSMTVLLGGMALVADVGVAYAERAKLSNAVDAAALAGVQELPNDPISARTLAYHYGEKNGVMPEDMVVTIGVEQSTIEVTAEKPMESFFSRILTTETSYIRVGAKAQIGVASGYVGAAPLAVQNNNFVFGAKYLLKQGADDVIFEYEEIDSPYNRGWFGALALGGGGASRYENNLTHGYNKMLSVGDTVPTESGNISGPTKRAIDYRISESYPESSPDNPDRNDPRVIVIPVYEDIYGEGDKIKEITIVGFVAFYVEEVVGQGNDNHIYGYFVKMTTTAEMGEGMDFGLKSMKLVN